MRGIRIGLVMSAIFVGACVPAWAEPHTMEDLGRGGLVWDQQPLNTGGPGADTDFYSNSGQRVWQQVADDILLPSAATIRRIVWWGFYGGDFSGTTLPPTGPETMRLRFYDARPGDGLPGQTLWEESFLNPSRVETGGFVWANGGAEYIFEVDLTTPFTLDAAVPYWLEVVQVGDVDSHFRWEVSPGTGTPFAFINPFVPDWRRTTVTANVAFQLSTIPEPTALGLFVFGFILVTRRKRRRREV